MYWILMSERSDEYELSIDQLPISFDQLDLHFDYGNIVSENIPTIEVLCTLHPEEQLTDNIVSPTRLGLLINKKIKDVFDSLGITNMQYFSAKLFEENSQSSNDNYCIANIIGKYASVDLGESELEFFDDGEIEFIDKLVLNLEKDNDYGHIFRLAEFPPILIISDELKTALDEAVITGFKIYKPEEFSL